MMTCKHKDLFIGDLYGKIFYLLHMHINNDFTVYMLPILTCGIRMFCFLTIYRFDTPYYNISIKNYEGAKAFLKDYYIESE